MISSWSFQQGYKKIIHRRVFDMGQVMTKSVSEEKLAFFCKDPGAWKERTDLRLDLRLDSHSPSYSVVKTNPETRIRLPEVRVKALAEESSMLLPYDSSGATSK
jgi:hypothetical protein